MKTCQLQTVTQAQMPTGDTLILPCAVNYYYITTEEQAKEAVSILQPYADNKKGMLALDIETTGFDPHLNDIVLLQIGTVDDYQYIFDMRKVDHTILHPVLTTDCWKVGHNLKFDAKFIKNKFKINIRRFFDTFLAEKVIRGGEFFGGEGYSLDAVLKRRLNKEMRLEANRFGGGEVDSAHTEKVKKIMQKSFVGLGSGIDPTPAQLAYAAQDAAHGTIFKLAEWQFSKLNEKGRSTLYDPAALQVQNPEILAEYKKMFPSELSLWKTAVLEFEFLEVVIDMELAGIGFSTETHGEVLNYIEKDYKEYRVEFLKLLGNLTPQKTLFGTAAINPDSSTQVLATLKDIKVNIEDTNSETLDAALRELADTTSMKYKIIDSLLNYRVMSKLKQAFGEKLCKHVHPVTGRIHFDVNQIMDTGRISNSKPNLQQIPKKISWKMTGDKEQDIAIKNRPGIRECFQSRPGYRFLIYDYSAQELRVAASITLDEIMLNAFIDGKELHTYSATLMYGLDYEELVKRVRAGDPEAIDMRTQAKIVSFGSLYGSGAPNLAKTLHIIFKKAEEILSRFWSSYPRLGRAMVRYGELANDIGYSNTVLGRRRYYTDVLQKVKWVEYEQNPNAIEKMLRDLKIMWFFEKEGSVTHDNMWKAKKALQRKFTGEVSRAAGNHHVQGTSADMTKQASIDIRHEFLKRDIPGYLVGLVHDEVIVEIPVEHVEEGKEIVSTLMKAALNKFCPNVPAEVEGHCSTCWKK